MQDGQEGIEFCLKRLIMSFMGFYSTWEKLSLLFSSEYKRQRLIGKTLVVFVSSALVFQVNIIR